jgi:hypothetical protein
MKYLLSCFSFLSLFFFSCSSNEALEELAPAEIPATFIFTENIHSSMPLDWVSEYHTVMGNLNTTLPIIPTAYFNEIDVYAWNQKVGNPYQNKIGDNAGISISGNGEKVNGKKMILGFPDGMLNSPQVDKYYVIAHEYFHIYQMKSQNFFNDNGKIKWLIEGGAATFGSIYVQQYYGDNYFMQQQAQVSSNATNSPSNFESYEGGDDANYADSTFMVLALVKELQKQDYTEAQAFRLVYDDYWRKNPNTTNWKSMFQETFKISITAFYTNLASYSPDISTVLPTSNLKIQDIF